MRRYSQFFIIALFPYLIGFLLICAFNGYLINTVFHRNTYSLLLILIALCVIALICAITSFITSIRNKRYTLEVLRINMVIKLIHIPAYFLIFIVGLCCMITIFTLAITILLILLDIATIILSGLIGLGGIIQCFKSNKISMKAAILHGILQFIFCADIISSIVLYRKFKETT